MSNRTKPKRIAKWARTLVAKKALGAAAKFADWQRVSDEARLFYVRDACLACEQRNMGKAEPLLVVAGIHTYFQKEGREKDKLSVAFGMVFHALTKGLPIP
jgi:hypothetical protein